MKGRVSVIIPAYNCAKYIEETLDSVVAQREPDTGKLSVSDKGLDIEIIVVDDGSEDETPEVIGRYVNRRNEEVRERFASDTNVSKLTGYVNRTPVRIILLDNSEGKGAAGARNTGIKAATGRYIAFLDSDDRWTEGKLKKQLCFMENKRAAFSFTGYEFADARCRGTGKTVQVPETISYKEALKNTTIFTSTVMFDMEKLSKEDILFPAVESEDTANWWKILRCRTGTAYGLNEALTLYRRGGGTLSSNKARAVKRVWNLYRRVEKLSLPYSIYCFMFYAARAVKRRV